MVLPIKRGPKGLAVLLIMEVLWPGAPAFAQQCTTTGTNQTCTNSIDLDPKPGQPNVLAVGLRDNGTTTGLTLTNTVTGTIAGVDFDRSVGILAIKANVTNDGSISGYQGTESIGIQADNSAIVINNRTGTISSVNLDSGGGAAASAS